MKNRKPTILIVTLALVLSLVSVFALTGCKEEETSAPEYTITYVAGEGATGTAPAAEKKKEGEKITLPSNPFEKTGHTFAGWSDGTTTYQAAAEYTVGKADVTFTATWTANDYTVAFAGGTGATGNAPEDQTKHIGDKVTLPANPFEKAGYTFAGWSDGTTTYQAAAEYTVGTANVTFTATWTICDYTVTYAAGTGATGTAPTVPTKHMNDTFDLAAADTFAKENSMFVGWSDGNALYAADDEYTVGTENVTLTAVWFDDGEYYDNAQSQEGMTVQVSNGQITFTCKDWQNKEFATAYSVAFAGKNVTLTATDETVYQGTYIEGALCIAVPVKVSQYATNSTAVILSAEQLALDSAMGEWPSAFNVANMDDTMYIFANKVIAHIYCERVGITATYYVVAGYYTKEGRIYTAQLIGEQNPIIFKLTDATDVAHASFLLADGFGGSYTLNGATVTLDGYGTWENGTYLVISNDNAAMVYLVDTEELTAELYGISDGALVALTADNAGIYKSDAQYPAYRSIFYDGDSLLGLVYLQQTGEDTFIEMVMSATITDNTATIIGEYNNEYTITFSEGQFTVNDSWEEVKDQVYTLQA